MGAERPRCRWCGRGFDPHPGPGRPREFCRASCRQMDYQARRRAAELGLGEQELIVARQTLDELHDQLYVLEAAVEDVERDLQDAEGPDDVKQALEWLLSAARPLIAMRLRS